MSGYDDIFETVETQVEIISLTVRWSTPNASGVEVIPVPT